MTIKPALTAEEWARFPDIAAGEPTPGEEPLYHRTKHGIAAANLHGQPFGFTWQDVGDLRGAVAWMRTKYGEDVGELLDIADRIEALLPPEDA